jgi:hypothetical protein
MSIFSEYKLASLIELSYLFQLKESVSGINAEVSSTREDGSSSSHRQGYIIFDGEQEGSPRQQDNNVDEEQEIIGSPRLEGRAESLHNDFPQNVPSQDAFGADKAASDPLQENNPATVVLFSFFLSFTFLSEAPQMINLSFE